MLISSERQSDSPRILERVAMPSSRGSSWLKDRTCVSYLLHWQVGSSPLAPPGKLVLYIYVPEKAMAPHSGTLAWRIPWTEEPGRLQTMGSRRVGHDWATSLSLFTFMQWRRKWQPTPVFLPGEPQGRGSLVGCRLWGHTESDMTDAT